MKIGNVILAKQEKKGLMVKLLGQTDRAHSKLFRDSSKNF